MRDLLRRLFSRSPEPAYFGPECGHQLRRVITPDTTFLACLPCGTSFYRREAVRAPRGA